MLQRHIRPSCCACHVLEVLAHERIAASWVCCVAYTHLLLAVTCSVTRLVAEEQVFFTFVAIDIFASQKIEKVVHVDQAIRGVENMARFLEHITWPAISQVL